MNIWHSIVLAAVLFAAVEGNPKVFTVQGGSSSLDLALTTLTDSNNNIYVGGYSYGSIDGQSYLGEEDIFLVKYDPYGVRIFTVMAGTPESDLGIDLAIDLSDNVYFVGDTYGDLHGQSNANVGTSDCFLMKYNSAGVRQFTVVSGSAGEENTFAVAVDNADGSIYVVGYTVGDFGGTNAGNEDIFLLKYAATGVLIYNLLTGSSGGDFAFQLDIDSLGNIYIVGATNGNLHGEANSGGSDIFLVKYSSAGIRQYTLLQGTADDDEGYSVTIDVHDAIYITGYTYGNLNGMINAGDADIFLMKFNSDGTQIFTQLYGSDAYDDGYSIVVDPIGLGYIYLTGTTFGNFLGNVNSGQKDLLMLRTDSSGVAVFSELSGTPEWDAGFGIAMDTLGNVFVTGYTGASLDGQTSIGNYDYYLIQYLRDVPTSEPTSAPTQAPTTATPSASPTTAPSSAPTTATPTIVPSTASPSTAIPTAQPTSQPSGCPSGFPSSFPSTIPTAVPSSVPSGEPSPEQTGIPSGAPSSAPSGIPSSVPSSQPSGMPSTAPASEPTSRPSFYPSGRPTETPTGRPSPPPSRQPSTVPTSRPSGNPTGMPSGAPSGVPSSTPTGKPSTKPTSNPSNEPTSFSDAPSGEPSSAPSTKPSDAPSTKPSDAPSTKPSDAPSTKPSDAPSTKPSAIVAPSTSPILIGGTNPPTPSPSKNGTGSKNDNESGSSSYLLGSFMLDAIAGAAIIFLIVFCLCCVLYCTCCRSKYKESIKDDEEDVESGIALENMADKSTDEHNSSDSNGGADEAAEQVRNVAQLEEKKLAIVLQERECMAKENSLMEAEDGLSIRIREVTANETATNENDWEELFSEKHNRKYWKNKKNGKITWVQPENVTAAEWEELYSEKYSRKYWRNKLTGESTWDCPIDVQKLSGTENENTWEKLFSEKYQRNYWRHRVSGKTSWKEPEQSSAAVDPNEWEWEELYNDKYKRKYWRHRVNGKCSWEEPPRPDGGGSSSDWEYEELYSEKYQRKYWKHKKTGKSTWDEPERADSKKSDGVSDWEELYSDKYKRKYWRNKKGGDFSWTLPAILGSGSEWEELFSEKYQKKYFRSKKTGEFSWEDPEKDKNESVGVGSGESQLNAVVKTETNNESTEAWEEKFSTKKQRKYWKNTETGETTWVQPSIKTANASQNTAVLLSKAADATKSVAEDATATGDSAASSTTAAAINGNGESDQPLPKSNWEEKFSTKKQRKYWKNTETGETTWTQPDAAGS